MAGERISQAEAARRTKRQRSTIHTWVERGEISRDGQGRVLEAEVLAYDASRKTNAGADGAPTLAQRKAAAEAAKLEIDAATKRLKLRVLRRELVDRRQVMAVLGEMIITVRSQFERIHVELGPVFPKKYRAMLMEEVRRKVEMTLNQLADWKLPAFESPDADDEAGDDIETEEGENGIADD